MGCFEGSQVAKSPEIRLPDRSYFEHIPHSAYFVNGVVLSDPAVGPAPIWAHEPTQYFEIFGNRGIYHDGWLAHTVHRAAWEMTPRRPFLEDKWELYRVEEDFSSANDLAAKHPEKLMESTTRQRAKNQQEIVML
jgi:arylsulfatase A-like enzyme